MTATRLALRQGRWGVVGFSLLAFFSSLVQAAGFYQLAGHTAAERAAFGKSITVLGSQFSMILPPPIRPDTVGGYVQWRSFGSLAILFAVWAMAAGSGAARGDEERGLTEALLATSVSRTRVVAARIAAFAAGSFVAAVAAGLGLILPMAGAGEPPNLGSVMEAAIALCALTLSCYALTLFIAQFTAARFTTAAAGAVLLALFLVNSLSRTFASLASWRWLSPFRYYELSQPLPPGGHFDLRATLTLLVAAALLGLIAAVAFARRDLGSPLLRLPARPHATSYERSRSLLLRLAVVRGLYQRRVGLAVWTAGVALLAVISASLTKSILDPLLSIPSLAPYFAFFVHGDVYASFLGFIWLGLAQMLFAAFAITQVAGWSAEDSDGRLEMILANSQSRAAIVVERAAVLAVGALVVAAISGVAVVYASHAQGIEVDHTRAAAATLLLVPFALVFAATGSVLAAWSPRAAVGLLGGFAFASYLSSQVGPLFKWPAWVQDLSAFKLYGTPLSSGVDRTGLLVMVVVSVVGFGASILVMERRDVGA